MEDIMLSRSESTTDIVILDEGNLEDVNGGWIIGFNCGCAGKCQCPESKCFEIINPAEAVINPVLTNTVQ
jgi:hypothetical protein